MQSMRGDSVFAEIYQRPEDVRYLIASGSGKAFMRALRAWRDLLEKQLRTEGETKEMYRCQGKLEVLDRILNLKEELDDMGKEGTGKLAS